MPDVAGEGEVEAAAHAVSVHRREHRDAEPLDPVERVLAARGERERLARREAGELGDVRARGERRAPGARDDEGAQVRVRPERPGRRRELIQRLAAEGVEAGRPVDRQDGDARPGPLDPEVASRRRGHSSG
jgi:hypothetical protein